MKGTGNNYVYVAYSYVDQARGAIPTVADPRNPYRYLYTKIVRLTYDKAKETLSQPVELIAGLPIGNDHVSGRLKIGPDRKLYFTVGDQGHDQLGNFCLPIEAQRLPSQAEVDHKNYVAYVGKSLRLNLDGSIPSRKPEVTAPRRGVRFPLRGKSFWESSPPVGLIENPTNRAETQSVRRRRRPARRSRMRRCLLKGCQQRFHPRRRVSATAARAAARRRESGRGGRRSNGTGGRRRASRDGPVRAIVIASGSGAGNYGIAQFIQQVSDEVLLVKEARSIRRCTGWKWIVSFP